MKSITMPLLIAAGLLGGHSAALYAAPEASPAAKLADKLDEAQKNQLEIEKQLQEIRSELAIVKVRATRRANPRGSS